MSAINPLVVAEIREGCQTVIYMVIASLIRIIIYLKYVHPSKLTTYYLTLDNPVYSLYIGRIFLETTRNFFIIKYSTTIYNLNIQFSCA